MENIKYVKGINSYRRRIKATMFLKGVACGWCNIGKVDWFDVNFYLSLEFGASLISIFVQKLEWGYSSQFDFHFGPEIGIGLYLHDSY